MKAIGQSFWQGAPGLALFLSRLLICGGVWWILSGGAAGSWYVGAPVTVMAALLSSVMLPPLHWSLVGALKFWPFFLWESLKGGVDVATRTLHRRLPLDPGLVEHRSGLSLPVAQVSVVNLMSLVPGTLAADLDDDWICIHALDAGREVGESVEASERHVAELFDLTRQGHSPPPAPR